MSMTEEVVIPEGQSPETPAEVASEEAKKAEVVEKVETAKEEAKAEPKATEAPTVPLSDFTRTKDVLYRLAEKVIGNEDAIASLAEEDPKLLERLKAEFPKKFKDVVIPTKTMSDEDIEERISREVEKKLKESSKTVRLDEMRVKLGLTEIEFSDIRDDLSAKADQLIETEVASNYSDAVVQAYNLIDPAKAKKLLKKEAVKELQEREKGSTAGSSGTQGVTAKFSKVVLDNYKSMGFKTPEEMVKYQSGNINISDAIKSKIARK